MSVKFAEFRKITKIGRFDEQTSYGEIYGDDAVEIAKSKMGLEFHSDPKVLEVEVWDENFKQVLMLRKNPITLTCIYRISR